MKDKKITSKARINKFIFPKEKIFLRLKATAKDLKIVKVDSEYAIEFSITAPKNEKISIPVIFLKTFSAPASIHSDAASMGYVNNEKKEELLNTVLISKDEEWGSLFKIESFNKDSNYYYLQPSEGEFAVKVGPLSRAIHANQLEIDWSNLQWGVYEPQEATKPE